MLRRGETQPKPKGPRGESLPKPNEGLPDSYRPSGLCPRCGKQSSFESVGSIPVTFEHGRPQKYDVAASAHEIDRVSTLVCRHCQQGIVVIEEQWVGEQPMAKQKAGGVVSYRGIHWWPLPEAKPSKDIPADIASSFAEAATCLYANCPRASAVMARRTLEAITADKGETKGTLADRLNALGTNGILHPTLSDWAKEVRLVGNIGAHFDPIQQVSMEDARQLVDFIRELLKYLYELPAELGRRRSSKP